MIRTADVPYLLILHCNMVQAPNLAQTPVSYGEYVHRRWDVAQLYCEIGAVVNSKVGVEVRLTDSVP